MVLLADTHIPRRARDLPPGLWAAIESADLVIHAGDWMQVALLDELEDRAGRTQAQSGRLIGVWGNNDGPDLRERLPEMARTVTEGVRIAVVHETGQAGGRERRMDAAFPDTDALVFGHSHIPWDTATPAGMRLLNPGSPTDRRRQPVGTFLTATVDAGQLRDVTLVPVTPSSQGRMR